MAKNENSTVRFLIFILVFLILILLSLLIFIIPNIKSYKSSSRDLKLYKQKSMNLSLKEDELKKQIDDLKSQNAPIIKRLKNSFDLEDFKKFVSEKSALQDLKLVKIDNDNQSFDEYNLSAKTAHRSPKEFYKFLDSLNSYKNIIKINFPIKMTSQNDRIDLNFHIQVFKNSKK